MKKLPVKFRKIEPVALIVLGLLMGVVAAGLSIHDHTAQPHQPRGDLTSRQSVAPSAVKPTAKAVASYNVPATDPKYINIPAINIGNTRIVQLGLTSSNQIAVPDNIYDTGWYNASAKPGQSGAMFIYGHVSSWAADGIFYNLKKLKTGDQITITRGDNTNYTYQVVTSKIYPYNNVPMQTVLAPINSNRPGLNLMTCTGSVIKGTSEFNERLVVYASLVNS